MPQTSEAERAQMSASSINDLPDSAFAYIEPGGKKDDQGKTTPRALRHFPIHDEAHVRNALARAPQSPFGDKAMPKIKAAAKKFGIGDDNQRADFAVPNLFVRAYPLDDIRILTRANGAEYGDGRTVEAVTAVFGIPAEVHDQQGHYVEKIRDGAFDKAINDARPQGSRAHWNTGVFYNHGMTLFGTPSERFSVPIGTTLDVRADQARLITTTRYADTPSGEEILEGIRNQSITGHSFTGRFVKSDPSRPPRGGFRAGRLGDLPEVTRLELGLREYGPTPMPVYGDTPVLSIRSLQDQSFVTQDVTSEPADDVTPDEGADTDEPLDNEHSSRDDISRAALMRKIASARRTRPGLARPEGVGQ